MVIWKIVTKFTRFISSTRKGKPVLMMDVKVFKGKNISRWVDGENIIYVRWNKIKNQSFLEISPMQKEVLLSHKLQDHAWVLESFQIKER